MQNAKANGASGGGDCECSPGLNVWHQYHQVDRDIAEVPVANEKFGLDLYMKLVEQSTKKEVRSQGTLKWCSCSI